MVGLTPCQLHWFKRGRLPLNYKKLIFLKQFFIFKNEAYFRTATSKQVTKDKAKM